MATEKFKMSYTVSLSSSLENGLQEHSGGMYQRETIFGKIGQDTKIIPFNSLSFADGASSVTKEEDDVRYTVTLQNKDLIIEAEIIGETGRPEMQASLSDIFKRLPTVYDENGNAVNAVTQFITVTNNKVAYISIPNMTSEGGAPK